MAAGSQRGGEKNGAACGDLARTAGSLQRIEATFDRQDLQEDERLVLRMLVSAGYDENGRPRGRAGALTSGALSDVLYPLMWEEAKPPRSARAAVERMESCKRRLRRVVNALIIRYGIPVMCEAGCGGGYYLPARDDEVEANHGRFHKRAMTGLVKASRARKSAYADAIVQLTLGYETEAEDLRRRLGIPAQEDDGPPPWVAVVTALLDRVKGDPGRYAAEIARIRDDYGDIFVRKDTVREIRRLSAELNRVLDGLGEARL